MAHHDTASWRQSFVTKTLRFLINLIITRFVRFCQTQLRTCKVWPISLISHWYSVQLPFLCQPRSLAWMSQHHKPRHTLLPFPPRRQSTPSLSLSLSTIFQFLFPLSFILPASVSPCVFLILTFLSCLTLHSITRIIFPEIQEEKGKGEIRECLTAS